MSPQPQPPLPSVEIDLELARLKLLPSGEQTVLEGLPGSVVIRNRPATAGTIEVVNLNDASPLVELAVGVDGSFRGVVSGAVTDEFRLQASAYEKRSAPLDITARISGDAVETVQPSRPLACLTLEPAADLDFGETFVPKTLPLLLTSGCTAPVVLQDVKKRTGGSSWQVASPLPLTLAPGAKTTVNVVFTPAGAGVSREVLLLSFVSPETGTRPVSVRGLGSTDRCRGRSEQECVTLNSCRSAYASTCGCSCSTFAAADGKRYEAGAGCAACPATCFTYAACVAP
ncbi:MAG: hypothetical protein HOO96_32850 [Polyangiaceae bacterium]|nr:hypothetical protein [Polyangiaceae bacterium]